MFKIISTILICSFIYAKPVVSVSIYPYEFFIKKIAQNTLNINVLLDDNIDEHNFEFKPKTMLLLEKSDIYFANGLEFEELIQNKFKDYKNLKIINTQENINLSKYFHDNHEEYDPHTWLDPILVKQISKNIAKALINQYPQNKDLYKQNLNAFLKELDILNENIKNLFKNINKNEFLIYHPSWSYFAKRYKLIQIPIQLNGKEPKPKYIQSIINTIKTKKINTIFIQTNSSLNEVNYLSKNYNLSIKELNHLSKEWDKELFNDAKKISQSLK